MPAVQWSQRLQRWLFECPGCQCLHFFNDRWQFNLDVEKPDVSPSILVTYDGADKQTRCHSYIRHGNIEFLPDCTHELAGRTMPLPNIDWKDE